MEDIVEFIVKGLFRLMVYILKEVALELLIRGPGYLIVRTYTTKKDIDVDGWEVTILGLLFWVLIGFGWMLVF